MVNARQSLTQDCCFIATGYIIVRTQSKKKDMPNHVLGRIHLMSTRGAAVTVIVHGLQAAAMAKGCFSAQSAVQFSSIARVGNT